MRFDIGLTEVVPHKLVDRNLIFDCPPVMLVYPRRYWNVSVTLSDGIKVSPGAKVFVMHLDFTQLDKARLDEKDSLLRHSWNIYRHTVDSLRTLAKDFYRADPVGDIVACYGISSLIEPHIARRMGFDTFKLINPVTSNVFSSKCKRDSKAFASDNQEWQKSQGKRETRKPIGVMISRRNLISKYG